MRQNALILFLKAPVKGRVKTRLAHHIGDEHAVLLYTRMCEQLLSVASLLAYDLFIAYDDEMRSPLPDYLQGKALFYQQGEALGERMKNAFGEVFAKGYTRVMLAGSDIPEITLPLLKEAQALLETRDAILSPTLDGGYYLIGFHAHTFCAAAFESIVYSQSDVYEKTLAKLSHLRTAHGEMLQDIDTLDDLKAFTCKPYTTVFSHLARTLIESLPHISVIIPVYHEDESLLHTLAHLKAMAHSQNYEVILVDTHEKTTVERLHVKPARIVFSTKGRAAQMNAGAEHARGSILLFLHADTFLPYHWDQKITKALHVKKAGAFSLGINDAHWGLFCIETLANVRTNLTKIPYGDQAHFFHASLFHSLNGYADIPLMEDVEMMKRLKKRGEKIALLKSRVLTSSRRWHKEGILYTTLRNRIISFLYWVGVSPHQLIKRYKAHRN